MDDDRGCMADALAVERLHKREKAKLGDRVQVLRVLIRKYYAKRRLETNEDRFCKNCEAVLDNYLYRYRYDLETLIDKFRTVVPKDKENPYTCDKCLYRVPWCRC